MQGEPPKMSWVTHPVPAIPKRVKRVSHRMSSQVQGESPNLKSWKPLGRGSTPYEIIHLGAVGLGSRVFTPL